MYHTKFRPEEFEKSVADYNRAIELGDEPSSLAKEFMESLFDDDIDAALAYAEVLENLEDRDTAQILENIVLNSAILAQS